MSARRVTFVAYSFRRSSSGSLANFSAMRRASSRVSRLVAERCDAAIRPESGEKRKRAVCVPREPPLRRIRELVPASGRLS